MSSTLANDWMQSLQLTLCFKKKSLVVTGDTGGSQIFSHKLAFNVAHHIPKAVDEHMWNTLEDSSVTVELQNVSLWMEQQFKLEGIEPFKS